MSMMIKLENDKHKNNHNVNFPSVWQLSLSRKLLHNTFSVATQLAENSIEFSTFL